VTGNEPPKNCPGGCGVVYKFTWDGRQSIFASGLTDPWDVAFDRAGNLFVVNYDRDELFGEAAVYKITPNGVQTTFASGMSYPSYLAVDSTGNVFVADSEHGIIYKYKPTGSRATFASGLHYPVGMAFNSAGNLFVVDNSAGNIYVGSIYEYKPDGSRGVFAVLNPGDRPDDLAFDSMGNLLLADLGGNIYRYDTSGVLHRHRRTTFGSVPNSAPSLACDSAGSLLVVDAGGVSMQVASPPTPSINSLHRGREACLPLDRRSLKASHVSLSSQYHVANEEQEWIGRSTSIAPGAVQRTGPGNCWLFSDYSHENFSPVGCTTMFEQKNALPGSELHFAIDNGHRLAGACQDHANV